MIDTFAFAPPTSAGAPGVVNTTLCTTEPKAKVTVSPAVTRNVAGVKARPGVAATVRGGRLPPPTIAVVPSPDPPHAASARNAPALMVDVQFMVCSGVRQI